MAEEEIKTELKLNSVEELFAEPVADPFDPDSRYISGIDEVVNQLRLKPQDLNKKSRLIIKLPQEAFNQDTSTILRSALNRYCAAMIAENQQVIKELRVSSQRQAISALIIVVIMVFLSIFLVNSIPGLQAFSGAIAGFVGIAIWVIFWDPIYNYVYAWRPNRLDMRIFQNLLTAELVVEGLG